MTELASARLTFGSGRAAMIVAILKAL